MKRTAATAVTKDLSKGSQKVARLKPPGFSCSLAPPMYTDVLGALRRANGFHQYVAAFMENGFDCMEVVEEQPGV